ncbi:MAG: aldehyde ferredoxin oxidoreductase family protein [bacterium]|nr:aldehyde ferredoxin oxidoreductase family protein [bacterium]
MKGYTGKILVVNLSTGGFKVEEIDNAVYEHLLAGVGLGAYYLYNNIPSGADALGRENILGFTAGLLTGTGSFMTGRWMAVCKSPLTGGWGDANCGGTLAPAIKQCGYDAIFFKGISEKPVYLYVDKKGPQLKDASHLWGKDAIDSELQLIKENSGKKIPAVAVIGPGGEKRSLIAGISNDLGRYAARSGVGAVMGSKRLKGLVLAGTKRIRGEHPEAIKKLSKAYATKVRKANLPKIMRGAFIPVMGKLMALPKKVGPMDGMVSTMMFKQYGSIVNNTLGAVNGDSPLKNWAGSVKDYHKKYYKQINPDVSIGRETQKYHCNSCIIGCGGICDIKDINNGEFVHTHKPEYETVCMFGGMVMNANYDAIHYINELVNRGGLDSISVGSAVAFAIECYENGILTQSETDGLELIWGNVEAVVELVKKIINREGIGGLLADGVRVAAQKIGKGSEQYAVHAGGQELPAHDPKIDPMLGVVYSADPTPGRHTTSGGLYYRSSSLWEYVSWLPKLGKELKSDEFIPSEKEALKNKAMTAYKMLVDGTGTCYYGMLTGEQHLQLFEYLNKATGWEKTPDEYMEIGIRMQTMRQMFNAKQQVDMSQFRIHERAIGNPPVKNGPCKNVTLRIDEMIPIYYRAWGWDEKNGRPKNQTVENLGLNTILTTPYTYE